MSLEEIRDLATIRITEQALELLEKHVTRQMGRFFDAQKKIVLKELERYKGEFKEASNPPIPSRIDPAGPWKPGMPARGPINLMPLPDTAPQHLPYVSTDRVISQIFSPVEIETFGMGKDIFYGGRSSASRIASRGVAAMLGIKLDFESIDRSAIRYMDRHAGERVAEINQVTKDRIGRIITEGQREGKSYSTIAREIEQEFDSYSTPATQSYLRTRAELVAVTEIRDAHETAAADASKSAGEQSGLDREKSWYASPDEKTCNLCGGNARDGWIPEGFNHRSGHSHPTARPGCRCRELYRFKAAAGRPERPGDKWKVTRQGDQIIVRPV